MTRLKALALVGAGIMATASAASAASAEVPQALADIPNLVEVEPVQGMRAFVEKGEMQVWLVNDSGTLFRGVVFDAEGKSLNPSDPSDVKSDQNPEAPEFNLAAYKSMAYGPILDMSEEQLAASEAKLALLSPDDQTNAIMALGQSIEGLAAEEKGPVIDAWLKEVDAFYEKRQAAAKAEIESTLGSASGFVVGTDPVEGDKIVRIFFDPQDEKMSEAVLSLAGELEAGVTLLAVPVAGDADGIARLSTLLASGEPLKALQEKTPFEALLPASEADFEAAKAAVVGNVRVAQFFNVTKLPTVIFTDADDQVAVGAGLPVAERLKEALGLKG